MTTPRTTRIGTREVPLEAWTAWSSDNPIHGDLGVFLSWEQLVAHELGGEVQGDYRRYDIHLPDGQTVEVKQLYPGNWEFRLGVSAAEKVDRLRATVNVSMEEAFRIRHAGQDRVSFEDPPCLKTRYFSRRTIPDVTAYLTCANHDAQVNMWPPMTTPFVMNPGWYRAWWDLIGPVLLDTDYLVLISKTDGFYVIGSATYSAAIELSSFGPSIIKGQVRKDYRETAPIASRTDKRKQKSRKKKER